MLTVHSASRLLNICYESSGSRVKSDIPQKYSTSKPKIKSYYAEVKVETEILQSLEIRYMFSCIWSCSGLEKLYKSLPES